MTAGAGEAPAVSSFDAGGLRAELAADVVLRAPGINDGIGARLAAELGFRALYVSGAGMAASYGLPDMSVMTATELLAGVRTITASAPGTYVVVDVDTGYGGLPSLRRMVSELGRLGVAAIHVEDQPFPKKCGYMEPDPCVPIGEMTARIAAAAEPAGGPVVIARTDALLGHGMAEALARVRAYQEAGAEMIMVNGITDVAELKTIAEACQLPMLHNVSGSDRSPDVSDADARSFGVKIIIYPIQVARAAAAAAQTMLQVIARGGDRASVPALSFEEYFRLAGWDEVAQFEQRVRRFAS
jgi:2-methylisocitrate lyase-like PEP mutase family enzyme